MDPADPRTALLAEFAHQIGGWNATPPNHVGRLRDWLEVHTTDEAIVRYLLERHESDVTYNLREEVKTLKAKLYDLERKALPEDTEPKPYRCPC